MAAIGSRTYTGYGRKFEAEFEELVTTNTFVIGLHERSHVLTTPTIVEGAGGGWPGVEWIPDQAFAGDERGSALLVASGEFHFQDPSRTIYDAIKAAGDAGYLLSVERDTGSGYAKYVDLIVDPRGMRKTSDEYGNITTVRATDGLSYLTYPVHTSPISLTSDQSPVHIISKILEEGIKKKLQSTAGFQLPLSVAMDWYPGSGLTSSDQPLDEVDVQMGARYGAEDDGTTYTCLHVIREILGKTGCVLYQYAGVYWLEQIEYKEGGTYTRYLYGYDYYTTGTAPTRTAGYSVAKSMASNKQLTDDERSDFEVMEAYREAVSIYQHGAIGGDMLLNPSFETADGTDTDRAANWSKAATGAWTDYSLDAAATDGVQSQAMVGEGNTSSTTAADAFTNHASGYYFYQATASIPSGAGHRIRISCDVSLIDYGIPCYAFLMIVGNGGQYLDADGAWQASPTFLSITLSAGGWYQFGPITSDAITSAGTIQVRLYRPVRVATGTSDDGGVRWDNVVLELLPAGEEETEETATTGTLATSGLSGIREAVGFELGDGPVAQTPGSLLLSGAVTTNWGRTSSGGSLSLDELLVQSVLQARENHIARHDGTYYASPAWDTLEVNHVPTIDGTEYTVNRIRRLLDLGQADVELFELNRGSTTPTFSAGAPK